MDYDIDIEEHDVLDNPVITTLFPDISVIKKEITQYFEEGAIKEEPESIETIQNKQSKQENLGIENSQHTLVKSEYCPENATIKNSKQSNIIVLGSKPKLAESSQQNCNKKLILGSNPESLTNTIEQNISSMFIKQNVQDNNKNNNLNTKDNTLNKNQIKLLLGSKPYKDANKEIKKLNHKQNVNFKEMKLVLQDIKSYLNKNGRYCKQCCTLYSSKTAHDVHRSKIHNINFVSRKKVPNKSQNKCSICGVCTSSKGNLLRHQRHVHNKNVRLRRCLKETTKETDFKCSICGVYLSNSYNLLRHYRTLHNKKKIKRSETKSSAFECKTCCLYFETKCSLSRHLKNVHEKNADHYTKKVEYDQLINKNDKEKQYNIKPKVNTEELSNEFTPHEEKLKETVKSAGKYDNFSNATSTNTYLSLKTHKPKECHVKSSSHVTSLSQTIENSNICLHCNKEFVDQKLLIEHMYDVLKPKINSNETQSVVTKTTTKNNIMLFVCRLCSYYVTRVEAYFAHLSRNHKTETFMEVNKEEFNAQCKFCAFKAFNITTHNKHVNSYHIDLMFLRMEREIDNDGTISNLLLNTRKTTIAFESVIFKCNKCCVCFLSSDEAKAHHKHTMDSNWKCVKCNNIFYEQYKEIHLKQHSFSRSIKIFNLNETSLCNVLFNCTKCAIHFTEKRYQKHFPNCGTVTTDSAYCSTCDILIDKTEIKNHKTQHANLKDTYDLTIVDSNIIVNKLSAFKRKSMNLEPLVKPKKKLYERNNSLTYCFTCKSYLTYSGLTNESHIKKKCVRLHTCPCDECGLKFTSSTLEKHKAHHKNKKLKIQDFKFFDLQGIQIRPAIPEYPYCTKCNIHFQRKKFISEHTCGETVYLTCDLCNIKLSENIYKLHMPFHFYIMYNATVKDGSERSADLNTDANAKLTLLEIPAKQEINIKLKEATNFDSEVQNESKNCTEPGKELQNEMQLLPLENPDLVDQTNLSQISKDSSLLVLYTCKVCDISVESYDEVIKHCQTLHYNCGSENNTSTNIEKCNKCSLKFDSVSKLNHENKIHSGVSDLKVLNFDPCYFTSKNMVWLKHIFQNVTEEIVKELLKDSIYQEEHRIRMECIQKGSLPLNVYKCDSCGNCVDPGTIFKHTKSSCDKLRKHSCTVCSLPFVSILSCSKHEKLHKQFENITERSLNIILFNQSKDKKVNDYMFNSINQYVLYQCRNCDRAAERRVISDHVCDRNSLKKCTTCYLLFSEDDFESHCFKHKNLKNFCTENLKVILLGRINNNSENSKVSKTNLPRFCGTVYDYTLYKCEICNLCMKSHDLTAKHSCYSLGILDLDRLTCSVCQLYFTGMKYHIKQHTLDQHFVKENINVITFNSRLKEEIISLPIINNKNNEVKEKETKINESNKTKKKSKRLKNNYTMENQHDNEMDHKQNVNNKANIGNLALKNNHYDTVMENNHCNRDNFDNSKEINSFKNKSDQMSVNNKDKKESALTESVLENVEILFKCRCGLHFLNKQKAKEHTKKCHPKELKQNCSKCNLLFNSSELFSHLLIHHKDKTKINNYKIIDTDG